jgi:cholesterol oxidase
MNVSNRPARVPRHDYDAIVVGSGFGGSVVAHRLATAERPWKVGLLERGRSYQPGEFPRTPYEAKRSFWDPSERLYGMFDVWSFSGLAAVVASGLGGGSLIYANVLERPPHGWLTYTDPEHAAQRRWPLDGDELDEHFAAVEEKLKPRPYPDAGPFRDTPKTRAFRAAAARAGLADRPARLAVQFDADGQFEKRRPFGRPEDNRYAAQRFTCAMVGECDIGCNLGAKHTLDLTYLSGVPDELEIRELTEVRTFGPIDGGFEVEALVHSPSADRPPKTVTLTCARLVLAAGTLGTVLLLLRNRLALPRLSRRVGSRFCGNGDYLAFIADCDAGSDGGQPVEPSRGPVITATALGRDRQEGGDGPGFHLQDGGFPTWASWLSELGGVRRDVKRIELYARRVVEGQLRGDPEENLSAELSGLLSDDGANLLPILSIGREVPAGRLRLRGRRLDLDWRKDESGALYERAEAAARRMAKTLGGRYLDPLRLLRPITVHPLGGCAMSRDAEHGVVDPYGHVHGVPNLSIADGSVLPGPVGINPALTIAALADRHARDLMEKGRPRT